MVNKYLALLIAALTTAEVQASTLVPRLIVNINIDEWRGEYFDSFLPLFQEDGLKKLSREGHVFDVASAPFDFVNAPAAITTIATGTTPFYHGIIGAQWFDRSALHPMRCTEDKRYTYAPSNVKCSTVGDELKIVTHGKSIVYSLAAHADYAILSAGHTADNAIWYDKRYRRWNTTTYYGASPQWLNTPLAPSTITNIDIGNKAIDIVNQERMGKDDIPDLLTIMLSAALDDNESLRQQDQAEQLIYQQIDQTIAKLVTSIEQSVGKAHVLFVITGTGTSDESENDYSLYRVPTGNFYINRTAKLLNVYLSALYGQGTYVDATWGNQIYLDRKTIEQKHLRLQDVLVQSQSLLFQTAGVSDVYTCEQLFANNAAVSRVRNAFHPNLSGDLVIKVAPGWKMINEDSQESYTSRAAVAHFPIIFYGNGVTQTHDFTPITTDYIAPTLCKSIRIRAPNACATSPLF